MQLYIDTLDKYLYYLDRGAPAVSVPCFQRMAAFSQLIGHFAGDTEVRKQPRRADHAERGQRLIAGRTPFTTRPTRPSRGRPNPRGDQPSLP